MAGLKSYSIYWKASITFLGMLFSLHAFGEPEWRKVSRYLISTTGVTVYLDTPVTEVSTSCPAKNRYYIYHSNSHFHIHFAAILSAHASSKDIRFYGSGECYSNGPAVISYTEVK